MAAPVLSFVEAFQFRVDEQEEDEQLKSGSAIRVGTVGALPTVGGVVPLDAIKLSTADHAETNVVLVLSLA